MTRIACLRIIFSIVLAFPTGLRAGETQGGRVVGAGAPGSPSIKLVPPLTAPLNGPSSQAALPTDSALPATAAAEAGPAGAPTGAPAGMPARAPATALGESAPALAFAAASPSALPPALSAAAASGLAALPDGTEGESVEAQAALEGKRFDRSTAGRPWTDRLVFWRKPDEVPPWPPRSGQKVRIAGRRYTLGERIDGDRGNSSYVFADADDQDRAVKIIHPDFAAIDHYAAEADALAAMRGTKIEHARLLARSADGLALVKRRVHGEGPAELLARGPLDEVQRAGLAEVAARYIEIGYTGDLHGNNLSWERWRSRWVVLDGGGFAPERPGKVLSQFLESPAVEPAEFLAAVRGRLGPGSAAWKRTREDRKSSPRLASAFEALARRDAGAPAAPALIFGDLPAHETLDDTLVSRAAAKARLGFDPLADKPGYNLKPDTPQKTNTAVREIETPGGPRVLKLAEVSIVRRELAVRALLRQFFAAYLSAPAALGFVDRPEAGLLMEKVPRATGGGGRVLSLEQRVALALLVHTFGLHDLRPANVLQSDGRAYLIDFETALTRRRPNGARIVDYELLREMPWVIPGRRNNADDYFPSAARWRAHFLAPESQKRVAAILRAAGYSAKETAALQGVFRANLEDLEWVLQTDIEFANLFVKERPTP